MPRVRWEALKNEVIAKIFMETAESKIGAMEERRFYKMDRGSRKAGRGGKGIVESKRNLWKMSG